MSRMSVVKRFVLVWLLMLALCPAARAEDATATGAIAPSGHAPTVRRPLTDGTVAWGVLVVLSVASSALIIDHLLLIRRSRLAPSGVFQELEAKIRNRLFDEVVRYAQDPRNDSILTRVVLAGVERYRQDYTISRRDLLAAAQEEGTEQIARLYRRTEALGAIGIVAPLLGLLGTVQALMSALGALAATGDAARPADLAAATSQALAITAWGLVVAIPALAALSFFRARIDALAFEVGKQAEQILQPLGRPG